MELVFREDPYAQSCEARVVAVAEDGIRLSRTVFYPMGGGQPGDVGRLTWDGGGVDIVDARKGSDHEDVVHVPAEGADPPAPGTVVTAEIDWQRRHRLMRMHTSMHLLCSLIEGDVTGGQVGERKSRLDFDLAGAQVDKDALTQALNGLIRADHPVRARWIGDDELDANPGLVRTMSVEPPRGSGRIRLIEVEGVDLQPCGGTHVRSTAEIGAVRIGKIESKGRQNRRINIHLEE